MYWVHVPYWQNWSTNDHQMNVMVHEEKFQTITTKKKMKIVYYYQPDDVIVSAWAPACVEKV